uniref:Uncharacterized protein n=1 Tax=Romanomermis culicivorax TaxID=13658 RepID=A0A915HWT7_ROMCU
MAKSAKAAFSPTDDNFSEANVNDPHGSTSPVMSATISKVLLQPILDMQAIATPAIDKADHFEVITSQMDKIMQLLLQTQCQIINQKQQMDNLESAPPGILRDLHQEWTNISQGDSETCVQFVNRFYSYTPVLFQQKLEHERDQRIIGHFYNKLSPIIQAYMDDQKGQILLLPDLATLCNKIEQDLQIQDDLFETGLQKHCLAINKSKPTDEVSHVINQPQIQPKPTSKYKESPKLTIIIGTDFLAHEDIAGLFNFHTQTLQIANFK